VTARQRAGFAVAVASVAAVLKGGMLVGAVLNGGMLVGAVLNGGVPEGVVPEGIVPEGGVLVGGVIRRLVGDPRMAPRMANR